MPDVQLKSLYADIERYHNTSGAHWDNMIDAGIIGTAVETVWDTYIAVYID